MTITERISVFIKDKFRRETGNWTEKYRGKRIHIVHAEMFKVDLQPGHLSQNDWNSLNSFFKRLERLKLEGIDYYDIENTKDLKDAKRGETVIVGGAIYGVCPEEHAGFLEKIASAMGTKLIIQLQ